ncbi:hypothetical protein Mapa_015373 [Marchantia paleacea]|nr:hypothetical protein Mapa_015373 [Marchantia paleacea]
MEVGISVGRMSESRLLLERHNETGHPLGSRILRKLLIGWCVLGGLLAHVQVIEAEQCGINVGGAVCTGLWCCSQYGWCGVGPKYCGAGCQSNCNLTSSENRGLKCGVGASNKTCPQGVCCNSRGFCGTRSAFCGKGCQSGPCFGTHPGGASGPGPTPSQAVTGYPGTQAGLKIAAIAVSVVALAGVVGGIFMCRRRCRQVIRNRESLYSPPVGSPTANGDQALPPRLTHKFSDNHKVLGTKFSFESLSAATNGFSKELGRGAFGVVYKGLLEDKTEVAVKSLLESHRGLKDFEAEIKTLGNINHANLVALRGFSCEPNKPAFIVYEYAPNGSLDKWIFRTENSPPALSWKVRVDVARGTARGLAYLHTDLQIGQAIIHLDIKPENILLDENFTPKVSDFGMAKLIGEERTLTIAACGTLGYMAPETYSGAATTKMDVYSFGMVLLELLCGRRFLNYSLLPADEFYVPAWALKKVLVNEECHILDPTLDGDVDTAEARRLILTALLCLERDPDLRCDMSFVWKMIEGLITPPELPDTLKADIDLVERILRGSSPSYSTATSRVAFTSDRSSQKGLSSGTAGSRFSLSSAFQNANNKSPSSFASDPPDAFSQSPSPPNMRRPAGDGAASHHSLTTYMSWSHQRII